jgi:hypothetical protein
MTHKLLILQSKLMHMIFQSSITINLQVLQSENFNDVDADESQMHFHSNSLLGKSVT